ncbi:MAG: nitrogen regulation protein NR(I) [Betaproteobacteria bacterium TMED156]|nr:MAG: nitrogen regulation protein NR(I) [Betaproteobacteria bacterium TMED156]
MNPVWIVDDDSSIRWVLERALLRNNVKCELFDNATDVLTALTKNTPSVLISDIRMPGNSGLVLLEEIKARLPSLPVIIMTAFSDLDTAVSSFQAGAYEYLSKPFDIDSAVSLITKALKDSSTGNQEMSISEQPDVKNLLGKSPLMQEVFRAIGKLSQSSTTVLVTGETGTGKELIAKALHDSSPRSNKPFIPLNMSAIPKDLLESELFGHEKGSFTGAHSMRKGRFEQANEGTLFLDEIGDMPFELQTRLLRVLSDGQFYRVGGVTAIESNVRVITATHQNLEKRVDEGLFREDLFHRINVIRLRLPALRERSEDIELLADHFLDNCANDLSVERKFLSKAAIDCLKNFSFNGNVRQLKNICHWLTVMGPSSKIGLADLPDEVKFYGSDVRNFSLQSPSVKERIEQIKYKNVNDSNFKKDEDSLMLDEEWKNLLKQSLKKIFNSEKRQSEMTSYNYWSKEFEKIIYDVALEHTRGRKLEASKLLNVGRNTITRKIKDLNLNF